MSDDAKPLKLTNVISLHDAGVAEVLKIRLENEGISCVIEGEQQAGLSGVLPVRVLVRADDLQRAKVLIAQFDARQDGSHESDE